MLRALLRRARPPQPSITPPFSHTRGAARLIRTVARDHSRNNTTANTTNIRYTPSMIAALTPEKCALILRNSNTLRGLAQSLELENNRAKASQSIKYSNRVIRIVADAYAKTKTIPQPLLVPFLRALRFILAQSNPSNHSQINRAERAIDLAMCLFEKVVQGRLPVHTLVIKHMQALVIHHGSALMRHRLVRACRRISIGAKFLPEFYSRQVLACASAGEIEAALLIMAEAATEDVELPPTCNEIIAHQLLDEGELDIAAQILRTMLDNPASQPIYSRLWGHFIAEASSRGNKKHLSWAWDIAVDTGIVSPSNSVYYTALDLYTSEPQSTLDFVHALCSRGLQNDPLLVATAAEALACRGQPDTALRLLINFGQEASRVRLSDMPSLIQSIATTPNGPTVAIKQCFTALASESTHPHSQTLAFNAAIAGILLSPTPEKSRLLICHVLRDSHLLLEYNSATSFITPNADTLAVLLDAAARLAGSPELAYSPGQSILEVYTELVPDRLPPSRRTLGILISALLRLGDYSLARTVISDRRFLDELPLIERSYLRALETAVSEAELGIQRARSQAYSHREL